MSAVVRYGLCVMGGISQDPCAIVGAYVGRFRGLSSLWVRWSSKAALIGENAIGKTRLLEAFTWLMGSPESIRMLAKLRPDGESHCDLSVVIDEFPDSLPDRRDLTMRLAQVSNTRWPEVSHDAEWWATVAAPDAQSWEEAVAADLPLGADLLAALLGDQPGRPRIRYRLRAVSGETREFERTLVITRAEFKRLRPELRGVAAQLAAVWDPLRRALNSRNTAGNDPFVDVLQLPKRSAPPVVLLWLPYERKDAEIVDDLHAAYSSAIGPVETLAESLDELLDDLGVDRMVEEPEGGKGCLGWA